MGGYLIIFRPCASFGVRVVLAAAVTKWEQTPHSPPCCPGQVQFSLISRYPLENGLLSTAKSLGVTSIAYSPLGLGLLTGERLKWWQFLL